MMLPAALYEPLQLTLWHHTGQEVAITGATTVSGGCINRCLRLESTSGSWFVKWNDAKAYPGMMQAEEKGLTLLRQSATVSVPATIMSGEAGGYCFLLMEYVEAGELAGGTLERLGSELAALHQSTNAQYGLDHDNYIGSLPQRNSMADSWASFFAAQRVVPQLAMARDAGFLSRTLVLQAERMITRWEELVPQSPPALLHGDLWSGNYRIGQGGRPWLIDPAVYYGHREMDIAMTQLFGGFGPSFYEGYAATWPLEPGWQQRISYHNLYPLLVHVNLFGQGYVASVAEVVKGF